MTVSGSPLAGLSPADRAAARPADTARLRSAAELGLILIFLAAAAAGLILLIGAAIEESVQGDLSRLQAFYRLLINDRAIAWTSLIVVAATALLSGFLPAHPIRRIVGWIAVRPLVCALACVVALTVGALLVYQAHPLSIDEYAPIFQAKTFANGQIAAQIQPSLLPRFFGEDFLGFFFTGSPATGRVVSNYWPGLALLLTPFVLIGAPWLLNPLISGLTLMVVHRIAKTLSDDPLAPGWAVLFTVASPVFLANGMSFYSMPAHLLLSGAYVLLLLDPRPLRILAAGLVGSLALVLHNPYAHLLFAVPWILWILVRGRTRAAALLIAGYAPLTLLLGAGWLWVRWNVITPSVMQDGTAILGVHDVVLKARDLIAYVFSAPSPMTLAARAAEFLKLWIWAVPALPALAFLGYRAVREHAAARLLLASAVLTMVGYVFVQFPQGHGWGSRYFHPAWLILPLFAAAYTTAGGPERARREARAGLLVLLSVVFVNGAALHGVHAFIAKHLEQLPQASDSASVILLDQNTGYYVEDLIQNDPRSGRAALILRSTGEADDATFMEHTFPELRLMERFPHGTVWSRTQGTGDRLGPTSTPEAER